MNAINKILSSNYIYEAIKEAAEESGRSINAEMVHLMATTLNMREPEREFTEERIRELIKEELAKAGKG